MKIEVGKYYRTRDGQRVGPMSLPEPNGIYRWNVRGFKWGRYNDAGEDGNATGGTKESCGDIIAEWPDAIDLTAITTPFWLLDSETQEALKAHGGPYQFFSIGGFWDDVNSPLWQRNSTYRVNPAPPKPREWWAVGLQLHPSKAVAQQFLDELSAEHPEMDFGPVIHVREVLE